MKRYELQIRNAVKNDIENQGFHRRKEQPRKRRTLRG